jgi:hypothetical protein
VKVEFHANPRGFRDANEPRPLQRKIVAARLTVTARIKIRDRAQFRAAGGTRGAP